MTQAAPDSTPDSTPFTSGADDGAAAAAGLEQLDALVDTLSGFLEANPDIAATIRYDLHAILAGNDTLGQYDFPTWLAIRTVLDGVTQEELAEAIGEPGTPGRDVRVQAPRR